MESTNAFGARLRAIREERGLSRDQLAARAGGVSADAIKKIERGDTLSPGIATIYTLARALAVSPSRLLDRRERLEAGIRDQGLIGVRDAVLTSPHLPGFSAADDGEPPPMPDLEQAVADCWGLYWQGRFGDLAGLLGGNGAGPGLLRSARAAEREYGPPASRPLAQGYQMAADLFVHAGNDDMAFAAALRAITAAARGDDPLQYATLAGTASWVMLHQGRLAEAQQVAAAAAAQIRPPRGAGLPHLTVYGALLLSAAAPAAAAGNADAAASYIEEARVTALAFTEGDRHDYFTSFGPTQVAMQQCHTSSVLGDHGQAMRAALRVNRADLLAISWGAHMLDVAQARLGSRRTAGDALDALWEAYLVSPEWARHQGPFRTGVSSAVGGRTRMTGRERKLLAAAEMR